MRRVIVGLLVLTACDTGNKRIVPRPIDAPAGTKSGVPSGTTIAGFTTEDIMDFCAWTIEVAGPLRTVDCGMGTTITTGTDQTVSDCVAEATSYQMMYPACQITVDEYEACYEALAVRTDMELCEGGLPPACDLLVTAPNCS